MYENAVIRFGDITIRVTDVKIRECESTERACIGRTVGRYTAVGTVTFRVVDHAGDTSGPASPSSSMTL